jgi:hypothetical protein
MRKKFTLLFASVIFSANVFSQDPSIQWQNTIGGNNTDWLHSIQQTADGGYILCGSSMSNISGDKTETCIGAIDYWIVKTDAAGNIQWQNTIGGSNQDQLHSIQQTADGGYILGGYSMSNISGDKTENNIDTTLSTYTNDYWIVKIDTSGNIQWQNTIGGNDNDWLYSIQQTTDGGYILGGSSRSNISGDKTENSIGFDDYWIVKTDAAGSIQWQNTIGGSGNDHLLSIQQTADGGYILGGYSNSGIAGDKTEGCFGQDDYWIIKTDATGNIQWQNTIGGSYSDVLNSIQQTADGGYILGGYSQSNISGDKTENSNGGFDYWIVKTDASGNIQWQNTIGGNGNFDFLYSAQQTADGGYILGGRSNSNISGDKTENNNAGHDYWVVKTDASGNIQWQNTIGGNGDDYLYSVRQTADGGYILGGYSMSSISGDKTENNTGIDDYWILKLNGNYNLMKGDLFIDLNSNNMQDGGEPGISYRRINETTTGEFTFSSQNGGYNLALFNTGNFSVAPLPSSYYSTVPTQHTAYFSSSLQTDSLNDFAFQPTATINDLCVYITPSQVFRPGFNSTYHIHYVNAGTTTLSPTIVFIKNNFLAYVSSSVSPASVAADSIVWNLPPLSPLQQGTLNVTLNTNIGTPLGTPVNCYARIEPLVGDANPACNLGGWEPPLFVTGSYDPNEIAVSDSVLTTSEVAAAPFLDYIIYFQNTGNDTAFTVRVEDILPLSLDASTMELTAMSHAGNVQYEPLTRKVIFQFNNILLPDSNINEPASHGYIHYRIKPVTTLVAGDTIQNQAGIYFDFNAPVMTNIAQTQIILLTGAQNKEESNSVLIYPNPVADELTVSLTPTLSKGEGVSVEVVDVVGKVLQSQETRTRNQVNVNVSSLAPGIYFVRVRGENGITVRRFVKQ